MLARAWEGCLPPSLDLVILTGLVVGYSVARVLRRTGRVHLFVECAQQAAPARIVHMYFQAGPFGQRHGLLLAKSDGGINI